MHRREDLAAARLGAVAGAHHRGAMPALDADEIAVAEAESGGVGGVDVEKWLAAVGHQPRHAAGAGHRVPLVADAAGVEDEHARRGIFGWRPIGGRHEPGTAVLGRETGSVAE
jgi:hypothetical protein